MASREERSRSPPGALALPTRAPLSFDLDKMELTLGGYVVKVYRFADDPEMSWFQAKPIVTFLGYKNITQTLEDNVYPEDQMSLKGLLEVKGMPLGGVISQRTPPGYNELKAIHINEPALYSLIFGSRRGQSIQALGLHSFTSMHSSQRLLRKHLRKPEGSRRRSRVCSA